MSAALRLGIDVGGTTTKLAITDGSRILASGAVATSPQLGARPAMELILHAAQALASGHEIASVGVGLPGLVEDGVLVGGLNLPGWSEIPIASWTSDRLALPSIAISDTEASAAAEQLAGGHLPATELAVLTLGTGVGTATVIRGTRSGGAGGLLLLPDGRTLEQVAGAIGIEERTGFGPAELSARAAAGDGSAAAAWQDIGSAIGWACAQIVHLLLVQRVVLAGGTAAAGELLLIPARRAFEQVLVPGLLDRTSVVISQLGPMSGALGAALASA